MRIANLTSDRSIPTTDETMSPLRMIEDMTICKLTPKTQQGYIRTIRDFAAFVGRSPDTASFDDLRRYQLHLATSGAGVSTINQSVSTTVLLQGHAQAQYSGPVDKFN